MRRFLDSSCSLLLILALAAPARSQSGSGGGEIRVPPGPCLTEEARLAIRERLRRNIQWLEAQGHVRKVTPRESSAVVFDWPLREVVGADPGYHTIGNFVDHDGAFPGSVRDYNCGNRSYDLGSGYNHQGTDFLLWPFAWKKMSESQIAIIAAEGGVIVDKIDGNPDQSCGSNTTSWNAVYVRHADGSVAWYGHMKTGSTTAKPVGSTVERGEMLGLVGSSGFSTAPHLHLEVYDAAGHLIDPYQGRCNDLNRRSWWRSQRPYFDSAINRIATSTAPPVFPNCPGIETTNERDEFPVGSTVYFGVYLRDQVEGQVHEHTVLRPDGSVFARWSMASEDRFYPQSYWYRYYPITEGEPKGLWKYRVVFLGQTYEKSFTVTGVPTPTPVPQDESGGCGAIGKPPSGPDRLGLLVILGALAAAAGTRRRCARR